MSETFPRSFVFGAATSSYQIEGAVDADGRAPSIWDTFAAKPGKIVDGSDGRNACEHYRLWREDVDLMRWLNLGAYRFSVAWPRVLPNGRGQVNQAGLDFYERLVDALLEWDIEPYVTLYHWDLPQALEDKGGWVSRDTASAFVEYADVVSRKLGDRVRHWVTHNEPWCASMLGYVTGEHAPGYQNEWYKGLEAAHHMLLSHGWAAPVIRRNSPLSEVGITLNLSYIQAASDSPQDADAARAKDGWINRWFLDPVFGKGYPKDVIQDQIKRGTLKDENLPFVQEGDLSAIATRTDFFGVNYYSRDRVKADPATGFWASGGALNEVTDIGWEVHAAGLTNLLLRLRDEYQPRRIYITENGAAYHTAPDKSGRVRDVARQRYLHAHLKATLDACRAGAPVAGYFCWSLLDNYEWAYGYTQRFGIVWVDYENQHRTPKDSAHWYRELIRAHALPPVPSATTQEG